MRTIEGGRERLPGNGLGTLAMTQMAGKSVRDEIDDVEWLGLWRG